MNAARRKRLAKVVEELSAIRDEEQEALENMPDSLQFGERGEAMQEVVDVLSNAIDEIEPHA
jgi:hypothetical protein